MAVVRWSPVQERSQDFAVFGKDLRVYRYELKSADYVAGLTDLSLSDKAHGRLTHLSKDFSLPSRLAWQPSSDNPYSFALSNPSGQVQLIRFSPTAQSTVSKALVFNPRAQRQCSCLEWSLAHPNYLALGYRLDRGARSEGSLFVIDVAATNTQTLPAVPHRIPSDMSAGQSDDSLSQSRHSVVLEAGYNGTGESVSSVCWLPWEPSNIAAGMGKVIKVFDIRDASQSHRPAMASATQKSGNFHISADPFSAYRLATFCDDHNAHMVSIWDTRHFSRPLFSLSRHPGSLLQLEWSTARSSCLAVLTRELPFLRLIDIPSGTEEAFNSELYSDDSFMNSLRIRNCILAEKGSTPSAIVSMNWHPKWDNRLLIAQGTETVREIEVLDPIPLAWSPLNCLAKGNSDHLLLTNLKDKEDISVVMRDRVICGYGFNVTKNAQVVEKDEKLHAIWNWLSKQSPLMSYTPCEQPQHTRVRDIHQKTVPGVYSLLAGEFSRKGTCSQAQSTPLHNHIGKTGPEVPDVNIYVNAERNQALRMCGWQPALDETELDNFTKREEMNGRHERAAALAVFWGHTSTAISALRYGATNTAQQDEMKRSTSLNMAALALAGYSTQADALWQKTCRELKDSLKEPYLKAMFSFLTKDFSSILEDDALLPLDRMAFACMYLNQQGLMRFLDRTRTRMIDGGDVDGLYLTGLTEEAIKLLSNYVDRTGDVQTACLIAGQASAYFGKQPRVLAWMKCYRELLDQWRLWHKRVHFDIERKKLDPSLHIPQQVFLSCNYCGKSINAPGISAGGRSGRQAKVTCCPNCRKPLPRCAVCLMHMGSGASSVYQYRTSTGESTSSPFDHWFTWCQSCRHGGHSAHILQWFKERRECPVGGCPCYCLSLDGSNEAVLPAQPTQPAATN